MPTKIIIGKKYGMLTVCLQAVLFPAAVCKGKREPKLAAVKSVTAGQPCKRRHVSQSA